MAEELTRSLTMLAERGETRGADSVLEDARRTVTPQPVPGPRSRGGLVWAAGAAAIVMVFVGLVVWLLHPFSGADQSPVITQPEAPVVIDSSTISWQSAPLPRELIDIQILDGSYLAISTHSGPNGVFSEAVVSTDGLEWTPLPSQPAWAGEFPVAEIERDGVAYPVAFVEYAGEVWTVTASSSSPTMPVVERLSDPAGRWIPVPIEAVPGVNSNEVVFAAGGAGAIMFAGSSDGKALLWVLADDGFETVNDPLINALPIADAAVPWTDAGLAGYLRATRLFATNRGFMAEFWIANDQGVTTDSSLRYRSDDGRTWTEDTRGEPDVWDYFDYAEYNGRILGVGLDGAWLSGEGGTTWTQTQTPDQLISDMVVAGPFGWIVPAGQVAMAFEPKGIWFSSDGVNWENTLDLDARVFGIAADDTTVVMATASGWETTTYEVWVGTISN
ncbi:MAG: hypothetical protein KJP22_03375 [Acidimicrobiia bacterium]|nr:hypothetical protein [Acidimicrobiia bacterium]